MHSLVSNFELEIQSVNRTEWDGIRLSKKKGEEEGREETGYEKRE